MIGAVPAADAGGGLLVAHARSLSEFGAAGDGRTLDTDALNRAVDVCAREGCVLRVPPGIYLTGTVHLRSGLRLQLDKGAKILGAPNDVGAYDLPEPNLNDRFQDFGHSHWRNSLLCAEECHDIRIAGEGVIDGGGISRNDSPPGGGDKAVSLKLCRGVEIEGVTIRQGGHCAVLATGCRGVTIRGVTIDTTRDGVNLDCCSDCLIENCRITAVRFDERGVAAGGDDAISLKSSRALGDPALSRAIRVRNCVLTAGGGHAFCIGSETYGDFADILVENVTIEGADKAGIGIATVDGGVIDGVEVREVSMRRVAIPFHIMIADPVASGSRPGNLDLPVGAIRNVRLAGISAVQSTGLALGRSFTSTVCGKRGHPVENVVLERLTIAAPGGGTAADAAAVPPESGVDERPRMLGVRPSYGLFCRDVMGLDVREAAFGLDSPDARPDVVFVRVTESPAG